MKTRTTNTSYRRMGNNIYKTESGKYRCRISVNGVKMQTLTTSLKNARTWLKNARNGNAS